MIKFVSICPHPPILLPSIGSDESRLKLKDTIKSLNYLAKKFKKINPNSIVISSPHPDWGFNVPLYFVAKDFKGEIKNYLTGFESPEYYFEQGKEFYSYLEKDKDYALVASGDLSHCLKKDGPYGLNPDGPKFDKALIKYLGKKDIKNLLKLDEIFPNASECGLRSFCFILGILESAKLNWKPKILSYEKPFGVGYLVADILIH
jgi:aromatic ring-opening dioxygenase LigB subunit